MVKLGFSHFIFEEGALSMSIADELMRQEGATFAGATPLTGFQSKLSQLNPNLMDAERVALLSSPAADALVANRVTVLEALRNINVAQTRPLRLWGMDFDLQDIGFIESYVSRIRVGEVDEGLRYRLLSFFPREPDYVMPRMLDEMLRQARSLWEADPHWLFAVPGGEDKRLGLALWSLVHSLQWILSGAGSEASVQASTVIERFRRREEAMWNRLEDLLTNRIPSGQKVVIMAHNLHIAKASTKIYPAKADGTSRQGSYWEMIGTKLAQKFHEQMVSIAAAYGSGRRYSSHCENAECTDLGEAGSLERRLSTLGKSLLVKAHGAAIFDGDTPHTMRCGDALCSLVPSEQYDGMVYIHLLEGL